MLNNKDKSHIERAKEFCKKHEQVYTHHKCKPIWDKDGNLELYRITINHRGSSHVKPRND